MNNYIEFDKWFEFASQKIFRLVDDFAFLYEFDDEDEMEVDEEPHLPYTLIKMVQAIKLPNNTTLIGYIVLNDENQNAIYFENIEILNFEYHEEDQEEYL